MTQYTIPLRKGFSNKPRWRRTNAAVKTLRSYLERHTKAESIVLGKYLNQEMWKHGAKNPPAKILVDVLKEDNVAYVELPGKPFPTPKEAEKEQAKGLLGKLGGKGEAKKEAEAGEEKPESTEKKLKTPEPKKELKEESGKEAKAGKKEKALKSKKEEENSSAEKVESAIKQAQDKKEAKEDKAQ